LLDALGLRALGDQLTDGGAHRRLALAGHAAREILAARRRGQRDAADVVDELRVDVLRAAKHRQARPLGRTGNTLANAITPDPAPFVVIVGSAHAAPVPAALPALRRMCSPSYFTPLPLYGSGGRNPRISAAAWPTDHLSAPEMTTRVGFSTLIVTPAG